MCTPFRWFQRPSLIIIRYWKRIPDLLLCPNGLRTLLVLRGLTRCVSSRSRYTRGLVNAPRRRCRFFSLVEMYFSLQHLSLPDAMVLTFIIAPILTGFSRAVFLREPSQGNSCWASACPTRILISRHCIVQL